MEHEWTDPQSGITHLAVDNPADHSFEAAAAREILRLVEENERLWQQDALLGAVLREKRRAKRKDVGTHPAPVLEEEVLASLRSYSDKARFCALVLTLEQHAEGQEGLRVRQELLEWLAQNENGHEIDGAEAVDLVTSSSLRDALDRICPHVSPPAPEAEAPPDTSPPARQE